MKARLVTLFIFIALIWLLSILQIYFIHGYFLPPLIPRTSYGLWGIFTMPAIHSDLAHLLSNTVPMIIFSILILNRGVAYFMKAMCIIILLGGSLVWILARHAAHIGASGLVFGFFGFLIARAFYDKSPRSILITCVVIFLYGGIVWGVLPTNEFISWEAHLFGFIAGIFAAKSLRHNTKNIML